MKQSKQTDRLIEAPMPKLLWQMCSQTTMSVMLFSLYSLADTFFVARGVGAYAAGAVALSAPIIQVIGAFASALGAGGASIISRALGAKDEEKAAQTAANTFMLFWICTSILSVIGLAFIDPLLRLLAADAVLMPYAKGYARIILLGAVTATGFSSLIRAEGNIKFSIIQWVVPTLVNLALDPLFIFAFGWGVEGAAAATVIAQIVSTCLSMYYFLLSKYHAYPIRRSHFRIRPKLMREILTIGSPTVLSQLMNSAFLVAINHRLGAFGGPDALSAFGIVGRIKSFLTMPLLGIVQGLQPIIGFNYAAKRIDRVRAAIRLAIVFSLLYGAAAALLCIAVPGQLMGLFIVEQGIIGIGAVALRIIAASLPFMGAITIAAACYTAMGKAMIAFAFPIVSVLLVSLPALYVLSSLFALSGIWYTYPVSDIIMFALSTLSLRYVLKQQDNKHGEAITQ